MAIPSTGKYTLRKPDGSSQTYQNGVLVSSKPPTPIVTTSWIPGVTQPPANLQSPTNMASNQGFFKVSTPSGSITTYRPGAAPVVTQKPVFTGLGDWGGSTLHYPGLSFHASPTGLIINGTTIYNTKPDGIVFRPYNVGYLARPDNGGDVARTDGAKRKQRSNTKHVRKPTTKKKVVKRVVRRR
jgi:hypothetical protein